MIEIRERKKLPRRCIECQEIIECNGNTGQACFECDYAADRFILVDSETGKEIPDSFCSVG